MPHARTDIDLDDEVLKALPAAQYKILRYLVNRADARGVCYPGNENIAAGVKYDVRHVERLVPELVEAGLVGYLRRQEFDRYTGRALPNIYIINPAYICIAEAHQAAAAAFWQEATGGTARLLSRTITNNKNQLQKPAPKRKPAPLTNNNKNQPAHAATKHEGQDAPEMPDTPTQGEEKTQDAPQTPARSAQREPKTSGVPPRAAFVNPAPIDYALPDNQHERLAARLRSLKIPMGMARGFVVEYSVKKCEDALSQTLAAMNEIDGGVRNPGGFFRAILQGNLTDGEPESWDYK